MDGNTSQRIVSQRFCAADSDLTFLSNDNVLFKVHRINLEILSEGFAAPAMVSGEEEVVQLVEPAAVLELLFQYFYPQRHPKLKLVSFEVLNGLAEAVEKYQVYPALEHCNTFMQAAIPHHPAEVLEYAVKHGYVDLIQEAGSAALSACPLRVLVSAQKHGLSELMDRAAEEAVASSLHDAFQTLSVEVFVIWSQYYDQWLQVMREVQKIEPSTSGSWEEETYRLRAYCKVYRNLADGPRSLRNLDDTFTDSSRTLGWKQNTHSMVAKLKPFSEFLRGGGVSQ